VPARETLLRIVTLKHGAGGRAALRLIMIDILLTEEIIDPSIDELADRYHLVREPGIWQDREALLARVADVRAVIVRNMTLVDRAFIQAAPNLKVVGRIGVGMDNLDLRALTDRGIVVCYPGGENAVSVAEHVFGLLLALARNIPAADRSVREGSWKRSEFIGFELHGKTIGILGLGRVGFRVAVRADAFGMPVLAYDPYLTPQHPAVAETGTELAPLERVLREADVVTCHMPLTDETRSLMNAERLSWMKPTAVLINTSRGQVVDEAALYHALREGRLAGAALDVRDQEPPGSHPIHALPSVVLTPHIASWTRESLRRVISTVAGDVDRVLSGQPAQSYANLPEPPRSGGDSI
jgi:D-3-phosphoglycerate dehydrogenase / 2-oxoglutarate reductase